MSSALETHFQLLDREDDFVPVAGRFVLLHFVGGEPAYVTSWDTFEEARPAALPLEPGFALVDNLTGVYWTRRGMFR